MYQPLENGSADTNHMTGPEKLAYNLGRESARITFALVATAQAQGVNPKLPHAPELDAIASQVAELDEEVHAFADLGTGDVLRELFTRFNPPGTAKHPSLPGTHDTKHETANS